VNISSELEKFVGEVVIGPKAVVTIGSPPNVYLVKSVVKLLPLHMVCARNMQVNTGI